MSALTPKKMREIEMLYRKMKEKPSKVFLMIFLEENLFRDEPKTRYILNLIRNTAGVRSFNHSIGTNLITAMTEWNESEVQYRVDELMHIRGVRYVQSTILYPARG
jgi:hypothetical protein